MPPARRWTPGESALLGTMPDTEVARQLAATEDAVRRQRNRLGVPAFVPASRTCRVCDRPAVCRAGFCHTHGERWRRWGKPDPEQWATAFLAGRLNTCAVCGRQWNGYHGCRHCSPDCLAEWKRESALARYHRLTPEAKRAAVERSLARSRKNRQAAWVTIRCVICGQEFPGPPHRQTCGRPECKSKNTTRGSRAYRVRRAGREAAEITAELQRRLDNGRTSTD